MVFDHFIFPKKSTVDCAYFKIEHSIKVTINMEIQFRPAQESDISAMADLIFSHLPLLQADPKILPAQDFFDSCCAATQSRHFHAGTHTSWVALHDNHVIGFITILEPKHVYHLFIDARFQRRGIAKQLWQLAWAHMQTHREFKAWDAITLNSSVTAVKVYQQFGFELQSARKEVNGLAFYAMAKPLQKNN